MYFKDIYTIALKYWPVEIDFSDGMLDEDGHFFSANLSMAWFEATDKFEAEENTNQYVDLMNWTMNRSLSKYGQVQSKLGKTKIVLSTLDATIFESDYKTVLLESKNSTLILGYKGLK